MNIGVIRSTLLCLALLVALVSSRCAGASSQQQPRPPSSGRDGAAGSAESQSKRIVKCSVDSVPKGAAIIIDGAYFGNTPSVVKLVPGTHTFILIAAGFEAWEMDLTVWSGSEIAVNADLKKSHRY